MSARLVDNAPDKQALKAKSKALIRAAGGLEAAAEVVRPNKTALGDYGRPENDSFMPLDVIADLEAITRGTADFPIVTRHLAARAGCALVVLPAPGADEADWLGELGKLAGETSELTQKLCLALADRTICARDVRQLNLISECDDIIAHAVSMRARLERIEAGAS